MNIKTLKNEANMLHDANKESLEADDDIMALLVLLFKKPIEELFGKEIDEPTDRIVVGLGWEDGTKHIMSMKIGELIAEKRKEIKCLVFGADAWLVVRDSKKKYDLDKEPRPSEHPDKQETLITSAMTPDMKKMYTISQIHKQTKKGIKFEKPQIMDNEGEFYIIEKLLGFHGN